MSGPERSYYCSQKFRFLKIDLESSTTLNCHAAVTHPVNIKWLTSNPGQLFNNPRSVSERQMMLANQRNSSCEKNCWPAEDRGAISPRIYTNGVEKTHTQVITQPETIDLTIGTNCNLTCSYCCKEYSSAWRKDIIDHGNYSYNEDPDRYTLTAKDRVLSKISQAEAKSSTNYNILLNEVKLAAPTLQRLVVTGGEPLLDNHLIETISKLDLSTTATVQIYTGLGVSHSRFIKLVEKLKNIPNLILFVSIESTGKNLEFNRYGNRWVEVLEKISILKNNNIKVDFQSTLSNLTLMGFAEFYKLFSTDYQIHVTFAHTPLMMSVHVLDDDTKTQIKNSLMLLPKSVSDPIISSMQADPSVDQKHQLKEFLTEFVRRRPDLSMQAFPESFVKWIGLEHVV
jgi:organic radical activating enzyme